MAYRRKGRQERGSTHIVLTRISEEEYLEWKRRSEMLDITLSEYIRNAVRKGETSVIIKKEIPIDALVNIASQYGMISNNFNQIAHQLNSTGIWSQRLLDNLNRNLQDMRSTTQKFAKVVDEINGDYKTQGNEKFRL